jgi:hypothetical protein
MRSLSALRSGFRFELDKVAIPLSTDRPFFEQVPPTLVYNVVASAYST